MGNNSYNITASDFVYGSLVSGGRTLVSLASSGYSTVEEIASALRTAAGRFAGLASINIRNRTQGWQVVLPVACAVRPRLRA